MNYRNINDLNADIKKWIPKLPVDIDLIVGIPRSGLIVANFIALHLNLPMTDVEGLCNNRILHTGHRHKNGTLHNLSKIKTILIVDDSVCSGKQIKQVKSKIESTSLTQKIYYAAVYITANNHQHIDLWYEIVDLPRVFEWNVMHHSILANSCVDIDGILCRDPSEIENDDGIKYRYFLENVKPLIIPSENIGWLVTCRLEKYRKHTEDWLKKNKIIYDQLIMLDLPNKKARVDLGCHASFKAQIYKAKNAILFLESSYVQAQEIAKHAGKSVLCTETNAMVYPNKFQKFNYLTNQFRDNFLDSPSKAVIKLARFFNLRIVNTMFKLLSLKKRKTIL